MSTFRGSFVLRVMFFAAFSSVCDRLHPPADSRNRQSKSRDALCISKSNESPVPVAAIVMQCDIVFLRATLSVELQLYLSLPAKELRRALAVRKREVAQEIKAD